MVDWFICFRFWSFEFYNITYLSFPRNFSHGFSQFWYCFSVHYFLISLSFHSKSLLVSLSIQVWLFSQVKYSTILTYDNTQFDIGHFKPYHRKLNFLRERPQLFFPLRSLLCVRVLLSLSKVLSDSWCGPEDSIKKNFTYFRGFELLLFQFSHSFSLSITSSGIIPISLMNFCVEKKCWYKNKDVLQMCITLHELFWQQSFKIITSF